MIRIGIIGMSEGNAHPYSWSAIVNGNFDGDEITRVGYPGVTAYLTANRDTLGIPGAQVTHVWAQERSIADSIAFAAGIETVVPQLEDLVGTVDAVILARDDAAQHVAMARPFIDANIPLFIDKPLAGTAADLAYFTEQQAAGKFIMSCSSMRYATECRTAKNEFAALGDIQLVTAVGKKDWINYGIHLLEGLFLLLNDPQPVAVTNVGTEHREIVQIEFSTGVRATVHLFMDIAPTFQYSVFGTGGWRLIEVKNWYGMFRDNLTEFIRSVAEGKPRLDYHQTKALIQTLLAAQESRNRGGMRIELPYDYAH